MSGVVTASPAECLLRTANRRDQSASDKTAAFRALSGAAEANPCRCFSRCADNESLKRDAASKHLRRESHARQIFVCAAMANGKFDGARINAAAISDAFARACRFRHRHMDAFAPLVTIRRTDFQFKNIGAAVVRASMIKRDKSRHFDRETLFDVGRFSNRPVGVKRFQTIHHHSIDVSRGLVLLFGIGTKALVWGFFSQEVYAERRIFFLRRFLCPLRGRSFVPIAKSQDGAAWCGRDDDQRGARFRARFNRATTLYPVGPRT